MDSYVPFWKWLLSLSTLILRSIHVAEYINSLIFFFKSMRFPLCRHTTVCESIYWLKDIWVVPSSLWLWIELLWTPVYNVFVNVSFHFSGVHTWRWDDRVIWSVYVSLPGCFPKGRTICSPTSTTYGLWWLPFLISTWHHPCFLWLHFRRCVVVSYQGFNGEWHGTSFHVLICL